MSIFSGTILAGVPESSFIMEKTSAGFRSAASYSIKTDNHKAARALYETAQKRLLDVNSWKEISGNPSASFTLNDGQGMKVRRQAMEGDYIRIRIPGSHAGENREFDWVRIEQIIEMKSERGTAYTGMRVRPAPPPAEMDREVAHFFGEDATSSFMIEKRGNLVKASVYGRNEMPNTGIARVKRKLRNFFVALGAMVGFSHAQWKSLVKGILKVRKEADFQV